MAILMLLATTTIVYATVIGIKPPLGYINNLRTCTKTSLTVKKSGLVLEYTIKGKVSNDRCEVYVSDYTDYSNKSTYEGYALVHEFANDMASSLHEKEGKTWENVRLPSQQEMIAQGKKEKSINVCRFNKSEREALYNAYQKNDGKDLVKTEKNKTSIDTSKNSSYDNLKLKLIENGPCITYEGTVPAVHTEKIYYCEYADMSCYYSKSKGVDCSKDLKGAWSAAYEKVKSHVEAGLCQQVF
jgi:hypothetical protein